MIARLALRLWALPRDVLGLYWSRDSRTFHLNLLGLSLAGSVTVLPALVLSGVAVLAGWSQARMRQDVAALRVENARLVDSADALADQVRLLDAMDRIAGKARNPQFRAMMAREIDRNARLYDFDPLLILAVVTVESRLDPAARGQYRSGAASGALGIMQVKPSTARGVAEKLGVEMVGDHSLFDPELNLAVGVGYLLQMIYRYRDLRLGIMAYNVGPGNLELALHGGAELPHGYYRKVLAQYRRLKAT